MWCLGVTYFERIIIRNQIDVMDRLLSTLHKNLKDWPHILEGGGYRSDNGREN